MIVSKLEFTTIVLPWVNTLSEDAVIEIKLCQENPITVQVLAPSLKKTTFEYAKPSFEDELNIPFPESDGFVVLEGIVIPTFMCEAYKSLKQSKEALVADCAEFIDKNESLPDNDAVLRQGILKLNPRLNRVLYRVYGKDITNKYLEQLIINNKK